MAASHQREGLRRVRVSTELSHSLMSIAGDGRLPKGILSCGSRD